MNAGMLYLDWAGDVHPGLGEQEAQRHWLERQIGFAAAPDISWRELQAAVDASRAALAGLLHLPRENPRLLLTSGSMSGLQLITQAFGKTREDSLLFPGDRILVGDEEFPAIYGFLGDRYRLDVAPISRTCSNIDLINTILKHICPDTRAVYVSHVSYRSGKVLPIEGIVDAIVQHYPQVRVIVDGSQAVGQIAVDLSLFHGHFYLGDGHKWLQGPNNVGFIYCRSPDDHGRLLRLTANPLCVVGQYRREQSSCSKSGLIAHAVAAARGAIEEAYAPSAAATQKQGNRVLANRFLELLKTALSGRNDLFFDRVYCGPSQQDRRCGIVSLDFELDVEKLRKGLAEEGVLVSAQTPVVPDELADQIPTEPRLRLSFSDRFNATEDAERACEILMGVVDRVAAGHLA